MGFQEGVECQCVMVRIGCLEKSLISIDYSSDVFYTACKHYWYGAIKYRHTECWLCLITTLDHQRQEIGDELYELHRARNLTGFICTWLSRRYNISEICQNLRAMNVYE